MSTNIPYLDEVWNLTRGCTKVSAGCAHCYAERITQRFWRGPKGMSFNGAIDVSTVEKALDKPLHWRKPRRVGVCFMSDLFHEAVPDEFLDKVFAVIWRTSIGGQWTPQGKRYEVENCPEEYRRELPVHTYIVLTKRPERMRAYFLTEGRARRIAEAERELPWLWDIPLDTFSPWPIPVWLGVSVENQETADERIPILLETPAAHRWVSAEPLLGPVDLHLYLPPYAGSGIDWIVVGGESGPHSRSMEQHWLAQVLLDCNVAAVPAYAKQDSGPRPGMQGRIPDALWAVKQLPGGWA